MIPPTYQYIVQNNWPYQLKMFFIFGPIVIDEEHILDTPKTPIDYDYTKESGYYDPLL